MDLLAALMTGFVGSLHCAGMCGPLAVAIPIGTGSTGRFLFGRVIYNFGRIATYGCLGALAGVVGRGIALAGLQQTVSIVAGVTLIGAYALPAIFGSLLARLSVLDHIASVVRRVFGGLLQRRALATMFLIGIANGFLPCGLVYVALAGAALTGDPFRGALFAAIFGLGTFPMMFALSVAGRRFTPSFRHQLARAVPIFMIILGLLFILRGLDLGIPMVSPRISASASPSTQPHHH